jgi:hypothetical protein
MFGRIMNAYIELVYIDEKENTTIINYLKNHFVTGKECFTEMWWLRASKTLYIRQFMLIIRAF